MSARRTTSGKSRVRLCATVTVQLSRSRSNAIGLPTMLDRPITTDNSYYIVTPEDMKGSSLATDFQNWLLSQVQTGQGA